MSKLIDWNGSHLTCKTCNEEKPITDYRKNRGYVCKSCRTAYQADYYQKNPRPKKPRIIKPKKPKRVPLTDDEKKERARLACQARRDKIKMREEHLKKCEWVKKRMTRNPIKQLPDRECIIEDRFLVPSFCLEFNKLAVMPLEELDAYWHESNTYESRVRAMSASGDELMKADTYKQTLHEKAWDYKKSVEGKEKKRLFKYPFD